MTNITMAEEDNNRFDSILTWIKWNDLNDGESLKYCQKIYLKPGDEEDLKIRIKDKIRQSDERKRKSLAGAEPKRSQSRVKYTDGIDFVKNNNKWRQWINLHSDAELTYGGQTFKNKIKNLIS